MNNFLFGCFFVLFFILSYASLYIFIYILQCVNFQIKEKKLYYTSSEINLHVKKVFKLFKDVSEKIIVTLSQENISFEFNYLGCISEFKVLFFYF